MPDLDAQLQQAVNAASAGFARLSFGKMIEIEERIEDPLHRWSTLREMFRQLGWPSKER